MSDTPTRTIGGLVPRNSQPDLSRLQRRNRPETVSLDEHRDSATVSQIPTAPADTAGPAAAAETSTRPAQSSDRITVYLDHALRNRARTAFRATAHLEGDRTWSDFIERAIRSEVERREAAYNANRPYTGTTEPLAPGRSVS